VRIKLEKLWVLGMAKISALVFAADSYYPWVFIIRG